ncbi:hypothetical protein LTR95_005602 [Oleoguttula sp. CCFEE 5521]
MHRFFIRRTRPADANTANAVGNNNGGTTREKPARSGLLSKRDNRHANTGATHGNGSLNTRPTFGQWIKGTWLDLLTMLIMGVIGLGVYKAPPAPSRSFPVYQVTGDVMIPDFAYPLRKEIVPIWAAAMIASLIPIFIFLCMQFRIRSFWDLNNSIIGLLYSLITAAVFQVFVKWLIGGLRPHFLAVCKPNVAAYGAESGIGFAGIMYNRKICTGDEKQINDSLESMPSGHSTAAFAGLIFLYLYLNAKLKVWSNYHPAFWKLVVIYMPVLGAVLIAGALTIDEFHNWYDVVAGGLIGTTMAFSAYRMVYASVWDFRFNHIPLTRNLPFHYGDGPSAFDGFHDAIFTRKAGWGSQEGGAWGGAPFDAAHGARGVGAVASEGPGYNARAITDARRTDGGRHSVSRKPVGAQRGDGIV